jgi:hypothetical protein
MRMVLMTLAAALVLVCASGCVVASSTQHGVWGKSVVVWQDELYVVDLKTHKAHRVHIEPPTEGETTEIIIIEENDEATGPHRGRTLARSS